MRTIKGWTVARDILRQIRLTSA